MAAASARSFVTPRIRTVVELAQGEANRLSDEFISTEHIFLAILSERNTPAARILQGVWRHARTRPGRH